jgi:hypothetical protein
MRRLFIKIAALLLLAGGIAAGVALVYGASDPILTWAGHYVLPEIWGLGAAIGAALAVGVAVLITRAVTNRGWERRIKYHLPAEARRRVVEAEDRAEHYYHEALRLDAEVVQLRGGTRGAFHALRKAMADARHARAG